MFCCFPHLIMRSKVTWGAAWSGNHRVDCTHNSELVYINSKSKTNINSTHWLFYGWNICAMELFQVSMLWSCLSWYEIVRYFPVGPVIHVLSGMKTLLLGENVKDLLSGNNSIVLFTGWENGGLLVCNDFKLLCIYY